MESATETPEAMPRTAAFGAVVSFPRPCSSTGSPATVPPCHRQRRPRRWSTSNAASHR